MALKKCRKYKLLTDMNVRKEPNINAHRLAVREVGTVVDVVNITDDWLEIKWNGSKAYVLYGGGKYATEVEVNDVKGD